MLGKRQAEPALVSALDAFLEAVAPVRRAQLLAKPIAAAHAALAQAFAAQGAALLAALEPDVREALAEPPPDPSLIDQGLFAFAALAVLTERSFAEPIDALASAALAAGATETLADLALELSFDLANPRAVQYLQRYGAARVAQIDSATREQLGALLADGVSQGQSYSAIATRIRALYAGFGADRAQLIATYEAGSAYSAGSLAVGQDLHDGGLDMLKSWQTAADDLVSDECQANADQGWIPIDDTFLSGDDRPLAHPQCRCNLRLARAGSSDTTD